MPRDTRSHALASDAWMLDQQLRAEWEAAEWKRLRAELSAPPPPAHYVPQPVRPWYEGGSIILKGLVRSGIGVFGAYMGFIAAANSDAGEFEIWLAVLTGFVVALSLSMLGPAREFVALLAEILRWALIIALACGAVWALWQMNSG